ncbi:MAG: hypothetical protein IPH80_05210 [Myxococcales bacterium]|nr:hypothetical protein [Myxococcales bacterium]
MTLRWTIGPGQAVAALAVVALACSDVPPTIVQLRVVADPNLALDQLTVRAGDAPPQTITATPALRVPVPDEWAGTATLFSVDGLRTGELVGSGLVTVTPVLHVETAAEVTLVAVGCPTSCTLDATRCAGDAVETCVRGDDGCPTWGAAAACPGEAPICSNGTCAMTCSDECTAGATQCDGASAQRTCANVDGDGCLEWSSPVACDVGEVCDGIACTAAATLTVVKDGAGSGTVTAAPAGISCGADCTEAYAVGTVVTLTAVPAAASTFTGWSGGGCSGTDPCVVTLFAAATVTASFTGACIDECTASATTCTSTSAQATCGNFDADPCTEWGAPSACAVNQVCAGVACTPTAVVTVAKTGTGAGTVTSTPAGIACGPDCSEAFLAGTVVQLAASPAAGSTFTGWSGGGCSGTGGCTVTASTTTTVTATFAGVCVDECTAGASSCTGATAERTCGDFDADACLEWSAPMACAAAEVCSGLACSAAAALTVATAGTGAGTVTSSPAGINCGSDCSESVAVGTVVTLTATPAVNATFAGWSGGGCAGTGACVVTVAAATTVTATFAAVCDTLTCAAEVVASGSAFHLASDDTHVYWTDLAGDQVRRRAKAGGPVETIATAQDGAIGIAVDATHVYWTNFYGDQVMRRAKAGGPVETIATAQDGAIGIAVDAAHVYWTNFYGDQVMRRAKASGDIEPLAVGQDGASSIALDATDLYWTNNVGNQVMRRYKGGGAVETLASVQGGAQGIAVDASHVYWTNNVGNQVMRRLKAGGLVEAIASAQRGAHAIALDTSHVYWTNDVGNQVMRALKAGRSSELLAADQNNAFGLALDATHLYWTAIDNQVVNRLSRCACGL